MQQMFIQTSFIYDTKILSNLILCFIDLIIATKTNHNTAAPPTKPPVKSEQVLQKTTSTVQATGGSDDFKNYIVLDELNDTFYSAIEAIKHSSLVAMAMEGSDLSRNGQLCWIQVCYLMDITLQPHYNTVV